MSYSSWLRFDDNVVLKLFLKYIEQFIINSPNIYLTLFHICLSIITSFSSYSPSRNSQFQLLFCDSLLLPQYIGTSYPTIVFYQKRCIQPLPYTTNHYVLLPYKVSVYYIIHQTIFRFSSSFTLFLLILVDSFAFLLLSI